MAWTASKSAQYNIGDKVVQHWELAGDSATYELSTGLKNVVSVQVTPKSATALVKTKLNILSAGTAAYGNVAITGATSGDGLYLLVIGN